MNRLSQPVRRLLALALLAALPLLIFDAVLAPLWSRYEATIREVRLQREVLARFTAARAEVGALARQAAAARGRPGGAGGLLAGGNPAIVAAGLQDRFKRLVEGLHGDLASTQILPARREGAFRRVGIRMNLTIGVPGLQRLIYAIESRHPFLFVDRLRVRAPASAEAPARAASGMRLSAASGRVVVILDLHGYVAARKPVRSP